MFIDMRFIHNYFVDINIHLRKYIPTSVKSAIRSTNLSKRLSQRLSTKHIAEPCAEVSLWPHA